MELKELLTQHGVEEDKAAAILTAMNENKIFTTSEENIESRYEKLREQRDSKVEELNAANKLVEDLKKATSENDDAQKQIESYKQEVETLQTKLADGEKSTLVSKALKSAGATDVDYLIYKLGGLSSLELDNGSVKDLDNKLKDLQEKVPGYFKQEKDDTDKSNKGGYEPIDNSLKEGSGEPATSLASKIASRLTGK